MPIGTGGSPKFCSPLEYAVFFNLSESFFATAYVPLTPESPLKPSESSRIPKAVLSAQAQFKQWYASFRERAAGTLNIRFFVGDTLAFCHTLQQNQRTGQFSANLYRDLYRPNPLVLDVIIIILIPNAHRDAGVCRSVG